MCWPNIFRIEPLAFENKVVTETIVLQSPYVRTVIRVNLGGVPFYFIYCDLPLLNLQRILSTVGTTLIFSILVLVSFLLLTKVRILANLRTVGHAIAQLIQSSLDAANPQKTADPRKGFAARLFRPFERAAENSHQKPSNGRKSKKSSCYRSFSQKDRRNAETRKGQTESHCQRKDCRAGSLQSRSLLFAGQIQRLIQASIPQLVVQPRCKKSISRN